MTTQPITSLTASEAGRALTAATEALESLPALVTLLPEAELTALMATTLRLRARAEGVALATLAEAQTRGVIDRSDSADASAWVKAQAASADAAVTASEASAFAYVATQGSMPGVYALLDHAMAGRVGVLQARPILREFICLRHEIPAPAWDAAIGELIDYCAAGAGPRQIAAAREALVARFGDEESFEGRHRARRQRRDMSGWRLDSAGMFVSTVRLDPESHAVVSAAISALSAPLPGPDGGHDDRPAGQRRADALVEVCAHVGADPTALPDARPAGAPRTRLILTMTAADLASGRGHATTEAGDLLPPSVARRLGCDALVSTAALDGSGHVLDVGRAARFATGRQLVALRLRDSGCSFPGCDRPPSWCDAHHIVEWHLGGPTDMANLALLCRRHHTVVHSKGYTATVTADGVTWHLDRSSTTPRPGGHDATAENSPSLPPRSSLPPSPRGDGTPAEPQLSPPPRGQADPGSAGTTPVPDRDPWPVVDVPPWPHDACLPKADTGAPEAQLVRSRSRAPFA